MVRAAAASSSSSSSAAAEDDNNEDDNAMYNNVTKLFIFIGLYILGIPTYTYYILKKNKEKLQEKATLDLYGSLYSQYQPEYWYWEIIEMLRKVFLCGGILTIAAGTSFQVIVAMLVQFFALGRFVSIVFAS